MNKLICNRLKITILTNKYRVPCSHKAFYRTHIWVLNFHLLFLELGMTLSVLCKKSWRREPAPQKRMLYSITFTRQQGLSVYNILKDFGSPPPIVLMYWRSHVIKSTTFEQICALFAQVRDACVVCSYGACLRSSFSLGCRDYFGRREGKGRTDKPT
jgi:hypothetical protein